MAFNTAAVIKQRLADTLQKDVDTLEDWWEGIVTQARTFAYQEVVGRLMSRGYSRTQVDDWDRGAEFEGDLALWYCLVRGGAANAYDPRFIDMLDRRKELAAVAVFASGEHASPRDPQPGSGPAVGTGRGSVFTWPDGDLTDNLPTNW